MAFFNYVGMQVSAKVVYYGPGLCGKTTNLQYIYQKTTPKSRGEMVSLETEADRTLFFDLLPIEVGTINGFKVKIQLYTVPGQVFYNETRKMVLKGVDGVVFVADSQPLMMDSNLESFRNLQENLSIIGADPATLPLVFQYNKRDLDNALPVAEMNEALNPGGLRTVYEAAARSGAGVYETLRGITGLTLETLRKRLTEETGKSNRAALLTRLPPIPPAAPLITPPPPPQASGAGTPVPAPIAATTPLSGPAKRTSRDLEELLALVTGKKKAAAPASLPMTAAPVRPLTPVSVPPLATPSNGHSAKAGVLELPLSLTRISPDKLRKIRISVVADDGERIERFENALVLEVKDGTPIDLKISFKP